MSYTRTNRIQIGNRKCTACKAHPTADKPVGPTGAIEEGLQYVRENVTHVYNIAQTHTHRMDDFYQTGKEHSRGSCYIM